MSHIQVEVIAPVLTNFFHCMHCEQIFNQADIGQQLHQDELEQYPEDFKEDAARLASWLNELANQYGDHVHIRVIDPQSPEGLYKSIRYWVRKYPSFIINGRERITGWDKSVLETTLKTWLADE